MSIAKSQQNIHQQKNISVENDERAFNNANCYKKTKLLTKLKTIIPTLYQNRLVNIKILSKCDGFTIQNTTQNMHQFAMLINQLFSLDLESFNSQLISMGFRIRNKQIKNKIKNIHYKYHEAFIDALDRQSIADQSQEQSINDKFLDRQQQDVANNIKQSQQRVFAKNEQKLNHSTSKRSNIILNKFRSQGIMQSHELLRSYQDISLQANLPQNQYCHTPINISRTILLKRQPQSQQNVSKISSDQQMLQKISSYKQNYERCSKLIDNTILKVLNAHRSNKIGRQSEILLNQITQIYDIMSDNIENVNYTLQYVQKKEKKEVRSVLKENQMFSPGFKPINQDI